MSLLCQRQIPFPLFLRPAYQIDSIFLQRKPVRNIQPSIYVCCDNLHFFPLLYFYHRWIELEVLHRNIDFRNAIFAVNPGSLGDLANPPLRGATSDKEMIFIL